MKTGHPIIDDSSAENLLAKKDAEGGVNQTLKPATSLGTVRQPQPISEISGANDSGWKILNLEYLPSLGMFYPADAELTIRAASVSEIRHWSTIDEFDKISINEKLNFILEKCTRFKIRGQNTWLGWQRILDIDRFFIIFRIYELTFPNQENKLYTHFKCNGTCTPPYSEKQQVRSGMLNLFTFPEELKRFYSEETRSILFESEKIGGQIRLFLPNLGTYERIRNYRLELRKNNTDLEPEFLKILPYLTNNPTLTKSEINAIKVDYMRWSNTKFFAVTKMVDMLEKEKKEILSIKCPKCGNKITSPIFLDSSFSVKDLFFISVRLDELI